MKAIIIDDEPLVREDLCHLLGNQPDIEIIGETGTVPEAKKILGELRADVLFLDIQLIGGTGFDLVPLVPPTTRIIFFTSYDEYALRAFEVKALDYLLKPVSADRLADSLDRLREIKRNASEQSKQVEPFRGDDRLFLHTNREQRFIKVGDILTVTTIGGNYSVVHLKDGSEYMVRKTMKQWEKVLPSNLFMRIHRASIVRLDQIKSTRTAKEGTFLVSISGIEEPFTVSRRSVGRLKEFLTE